MFETDLAAHGYLADHVVAGSAMFPAAGYLALAMAAAVEVAPQQTVNIAQAGADPYTSSPPLAIAHLLEQRAAQPGELGLVIAAGAGIQVACALYQF